MVVTGLPNPQPVFHIKTKFYKRDGNVNKQIDNTINGPNESMRSVKNKKKVKLQLLVTS